MVDLEEPPTACDSFPDSQILPCSRQTAPNGIDVVIARLPHINRFLYIGNLLQKGVSPVHRAVSAEGTFASRAAIQPGGRAVKIYSADLMSHTTATAENPAKEIAVLQYLCGRHPNIISILGCFQNPLSREVYLEMPLYEGDALTLVESAPRRFGTPYLPMAIIKNAMMSLLSALSFLHSLGITHHDVSPEQLLYDPHQNRFVLIDFGMCIRQAYNPSTGGFDPYPHRHFCGKVSYMAYEVITRAEVPSPDPTKRDIWAAGATLFMLLTGAFLNKIDRQLWLIDSTFYQNVSGRVDAIKDAHRVDRGEDYDAAMACVAAMMPFAPSERPTAAMVSQHPWFSL